MKRAQFIFEKMITQELRSHSSLGPGLTLSTGGVLIETMSVYQEPFEPGEWIQSLHGARVTLGEYFKWLYYSRVWKP